MESKEQEAIQLLKEIVIWWDEWNESPFPADMEDPPIDEARELLKELAILDKTK